MFGSYNGEQSSLHNEDASSPGRWALLVAEKTDFYLLQGLLWCALCDESLACCLMSTGVRYYCCANVGCPRSLINAEEVEQVVWKAFALKHKTEAATTNRNERQAALHEALTRVTVHSGASELDFEWVE